MQNVPESPSAYQRPSTSRTRTPSPSVRISGLSLKPCIWVKSIITLPTASMSSREGIVDHSHCQQSSRVAGGHERGPGYLHDRPDGGGEAVRRAPGSALVEPV